METNGLFNISLIIQKHERTGEIKKEIADELYASIGLLEKYLIAYYKDNKVNWHDITKNPSAYQTGQEFFDSEMKRTVESNESQQGK